MQALEFETNISGKTLTLPAEIADKISQGQHVRVIMLLDETKPQQPTPQNPLTALLESGLVGCAEADPKLSKNYKAEFSQSLEEKSAIRKKEKIDINQFSFAQAQAISKDLKSSLSDAILEERRNERKNHATRKAVLVGMGTRIDITPTQTHGRQRL